MTASTVIGFELNKKFGDIYIGKHETTERLELAFTRQLTKKEKNVLDKIMKDVPYTTEIINKQVA